LGGPQLTKVLGAILIVWNSFFLGFPSQVNLEPGGSKVPTFFPLKLGAGSGCFAQTGTAGTLFFPIGGIPPFIPGTFSGKASGDWFLGPPSFVDPRVFLFSVVKKTALVPKKKDLSPRVDS